MPDWICVKKINYLGKWKKNILILPIAPSASGSTAEADGADGPRTLANEGSGSKQKHFFK